MFMIDQIRGYGAAPKYSPKSVPVQAQQYSAYGMDLGGAPTMGQLYQGVMGQMKGWGNAQQVGMRQEYLNAMGKGMQSLASSGLAGTSVAPSMRMGYMQQYQNALNNLNQQLTQQRISAQTQLGTEATRQSMQYQQMNQQSQESAQRLGLAYAGLNQQALAQQQSNQLGQEQLRLQQLRAAQAYMASGAGGLRTGAANPYGLAANPLPRALPPAQLGNYGGIMGVR